MNLVRRPKYFVSSRNVQHIGWQREYLNYAKIKTLFDGSGGKVAVLDDGVYDRHNELLKDHTITAGRYSDNNYKVKRWVDHTSDGGFGEGDHSTHVSGVICGNEVGIFPKMEIGSYKVLTSRQGIGTLHWLIEGIEYAIKDGYEVINLSLSTDKPDQNVYECIKKYPHVTFVCAAGNDFKDTDYPAAYAKELSNVISVGAINEKIRVSEFSSKGVVTTVAPGTNIYSSIAGDNYTLMSGTSQATPLISALYAASKVLYKGFTTKDFIEAARQCSLDVETGTSADGLGVIDFVKYLKLIKGDKEMNTIYKPSSSYTKGFTLIPKGIVLHHGVGSYSSIINTCLNPSNRVSYHAVVNLDGEITVCVEDNKKAWHSGKSIFKGKPNCNDYMLGICVSGDTNKRELTDLEVDSIVRWCRSKMDKYGFGTDMITTHMEISPNRKTDVDDRAYEKIINTLRL